jgi:hypothetical protein
VKFLHSDHGGEYLGKEFTIYLKSKGTAQKLTVHDTSQHNGIAEHRNCTIVKRICALLHVSGLLKTLWGEVAHHVIWLLNQTSTKAIEDMTPYEAAFGKKPDLQHVQEWGKKVWVHIEGGDKLGGCVREGVDERSKGFRVYWPDKQIVSTEQNIYYDKTCLSVDHLEGEDWEFIKTTTDSPNSLAAPTSIPASAATPAATPAAPETCVPTPTPSYDDNPPEEEPIPTKHIRKPSQHVHDLIEGCGATSACPSDLAVAPGIQLPPVAEEAPDVVLEEEGLAD